MELKYDDATEYEYVQYHLLIAPIMELKLSRPTKKYASYEAALWLF